jgi:hypothetical protein
MVGMKKKYASRGGALRRAGGGMMKKKYASKGGALRRKRGGTVKRRTGGRTR